MSTYPRLPVVVLSGVRGRRQDPGALVILLAVADLLTSEPVLAGGPHVGRE